TRVGDVGAGQIAKAANQVIVGLTIAAVSEGLALAARAGADIARVREALQGGFADSRILQVHGERMQGGEFPAGGRCSTQRKDLDQAMELAGQMGLELPVTALCRDLYDRLIADGDGDLDHSALFKLYRCARCRPSRRHFGIVPGAEFQGFFMAVEGVCSCIVSRSTGS